MDLNFLSKLKEKKYEHCFWILEEDYGKVYESHDDLSIRHLYGKDRKVFVEVLKNRPDVKFRLLPVGESAITYKASDEKLPSIEFSFSRIGAYTEYSTEAGSIFNPKTMKQLEELCQRHDSEISVDLLKHTFTLTYYTEILVFGDTDVDSSDEELTEVFNTSDESE